MLCEKCKKKEATVFYEENINGNSRSYSLCSDCAKSLENSGEISLHQSIENSFLGGSPFGSIADNFFGGLFGIPENTRTSKKICPLCAASFDDFRKTAKAGCPVCYEAFADELRGTVRSIHGQVKHIGRAPAKFKKRNEKKTRLAELKTKLKQAIADENFEQAATLRDQIHAMEAEN